MVKQIFIQNFKSIKELEFEAKRVNIFIGEPNTGKSNILEALGLYSVIHKPTDLKNFTRFKDVSNLFYQNNPLNPIKIFLHSEKQLMLYPKKSLVDINTEEQVYQVGIGDKNDFFVKFDFSSEGKYLNFYDVNYALNTLGFKDIMYYKFQPITVFPSKFVFHLLPPFGENLFEILYTNRLVKNEVERILEEKGYKLFLETKNRDISFVVANDSSLLGYPYETLSDTLQRIIFYTAAIESNKNAVLLFEEPEANTFPFYTKELGERIAYDESNQYFIVTHNPYFLMALVEKTPTIDLNVFITYMDNYQTKLHRIADEELSDVVDLNTSIFFNLDRFLAPA
ncbi:MAG: AAA family ATPase [Spirosomataceae bacterium]